MLNNKTPTYLYAHTYICTHIDTNTLKNNILLYTVTLLTSLFCCGVNVVVFVVRSYTHETLNNKKFIFCYLFLALTFKTVNQPFYKGGEF